jgi:hypothetical protein
MNRYALSGTTVPSNERQFEPAQEAIDIFNEVQAAEEFYQELVAQDKACDEVFAVLENLHTLAAALVDGFYTKEAIEQLNAGGDLTQLTGYATEAITPQIAQEAIKDNMTKVWEGLKKFIANIIDTIANFFAKLFNMASAQAQKIIDTKGNDIDFSAEKETLTVEQVKNLREACEGLNAFVAKHVDVKNYFLVSTAKITGVSAEGDNSNEFKNVAENLNKDISAFVAKSNNILKAEDGKVTIMDEALKREKKVLSTAGWTATAAVELAKYFLDNKGKATRLGELMKRLKSLNVQGNMIGSAFSMAKMACRAETSAYACYAKCLRAFGKQVKCLNGANKKASETTGKK